MKIKVQEKTPPQVAELVFELLDIFGQIGMPLDETERRLERMAKACLAVAKIRNSFSEAQSVEGGVFSRTRDIIAFENEHYGENISPGSYDDIRRMDLLLPVEAGIIVNSSSVEQQATNNPSRGYGMSSAFAGLVRSYGTPSWQRRLERYIKANIHLKDELDRVRNLEKMPVTLPGGKTIELSYGAHNELQKAIVEEFLPRFGFGAEVLYIGDTSNKFLHVERDALGKIHFFALEHEELPDVVAYSQSKNLLYLIEAYHSTGEWNEMRVRKVKRKLEECGCTAKAVFFTAFEDRESFRRKAKDIAWETEVWIADAPDHLVHFNGYKFLEIQDSQ